MKIIHDMHLIRIKNVKRSSLLFRLRIYIPIVWFFRAFGVIAPAVDELLLSQNENRQRLLKIIRRRRRPPFAVALGRRRLLTLVYATSLGISVWMIRSISRARARSSALHYELKS